MKTIFFIIEIAGVVVALIFGYLWLKDPSGPYEPVTFMALLIGTIVVEILRCHTAAESNKNTSSETLTNSSKNTITYLFFMTYV